MNKRLQLQLLKILRRCIILIDKYVLFVKKWIELVGHFPLANSSKFANFKSWKLAVIVNFEDGDGMQVAGKFLIQQDQEKCLIYYNNVSWEKKYTFPIHSLPFFPSMLQPIWSLGLIQNTILLYTLMFFLNTIKSDIHLKYACSAHS